MNDEVQIQHPKRETPHDTPLGLTIEERLSARRLIQDEPKISRLADHHGELLAHLLEWERKKWLFGAGRDILKWLVPVLGGVGLAITFLKPALQEWLTK